MAYREHCVLVQQKLYILVAFTNGVIHRSVLSLSQTSKLFSRDIRHCEHFNSICIPISLFSILVWCSAFHWVWWLGSHAHLTCWGDQVMLCPYFLCSNLGEIVWSDLYTSISPEYCSYIWLLPDLPCMKVIMFILRVGVHVWYIHAACTKSSWPAAVTLCASLAVLMT